MELTIDKALQRGIEAHKVGKVQEAEQYYTAILQVQSKHPDANHNMGVLAVGVGKVQESLSFFKTALETSPTAAQYWLSYIDALIRLDRMDEAKTVLDQAKSKGANGDGFDKLEHQLNEVIGKTLETTGAAPSQSQVESLINLYTQGQLQQALEQVIELLQQFPNSSMLDNISGAVHKGLGRLDASIDAYKEALSIKPVYDEAY